jgi:hypothetical protein
MEGEDRTCSSRAASESSAAVERENSIFALSCSRYLRKGGKVHAPLRDSSVWAWPPATECCYGMSAACSGFVQHVGGSRNVRATCCNSARRVATCSQYTHHTSAVISHAPGGRIGERARHSLHRDWGARPCPHLHRDCGLAPAHICTATGSSPLPTSAPRLSGVEASARKERFVGVAVADVRDQIPATPDRLERGMGRRYEHCAGEDVRIMAVPRRLLVDTSACMPCRDKHGPNGPHGGMARRY